MESKPTARSFNFFKRAGLAGAACVTCGILLTGIPVWADSPLDAPAATTAPIEIWRGVRRVDTFPRKQPEPQSREVDSQAAGTTAASKPLNSLAPIPTPAVADVPFSHRDLAPKAQPGSEEESSAVGADATSAPPRRDRSNNVKDLPVTLAGELAESTANRHADERVLVPFPMATSSNNGAWLQALSTFAGSVLTPLILLAGLFLLLRRLKGQAGPIIRVEYVGSQPTLALDQLAGLLRGNGSQAAPNPSVVAAPAAPALKPSSTAQPFELGPTFEEDRLQREQHVQQADAGVLRKLYEDNLKLQEQLREPIVVAL